MKAIPKKKVQKEIATKLNEVAGSDLKPKDVTPEKIERVAAGDSSGNKKLYMALAAVLPTILGAAIGGARGGQIGAEQTGKIAEAYGKIESEKEQASKDQAAKLEQIQAAALTRADERSDDRDFKSQESQANRDNQLAQSRILAGGRALDAESRLADKRDIRESALIEKQVQRMVNGYGEANTVEDAKALKAGIESKAGFDSKINELIALRESKGGGAILDREAVARAGQLSKDLLLSYKEMAKLGVLSVADEKILNAIIPPDPLQYNSPLAAIQGQDPILNNLKQFQADSEKDFQTRLKTRLRANQQQSTEPDFDSMSEEELKAYLGKR